MPRILSILAATLLALIAGCASLPPPEGRTATTAFADTSETRLGRALAAGVAANPGKTGVHPLREGTDAFAARVLLATAAERSLDAQYYIWHGDQVGYLLFEALWQAAGRGVRVRLLLDDLNTDGLDATIATLDAHPNIEVRLYNPVVERKRPRAQLPDRFHARQPPDAQQVVHRRQPGQHRRRPQHRQRVLRRRGRDRLRRSRRHRRRRCRARRVEGVRSLLEQRVRLSGSELRRGAGPGRCGRARGPLRVEPRGFGLRRLRRGRTRDAHRPRHARTDARIRVDNGAGRPRRSGEDARRDGLVRRAAVPGPRRSDGAAGADARPRVALPRSRGRRNRRARRARGSRREGPDTHQFARGDRRTRGARGLRQAPPGAARGWSNALRAQADGDARSARWTGMVRVGLVVRAPRQDVRRRPAIASSSARSTSTSARRTSTPRWAS